MPFSFIPPFLVFAFFFSSALSFNVTIGSSSPTECGPLDVTWTGGQAPFQITLTPVYAIPRNYSVPSSSFNNNEGSYQIPAVPFVQGQRFLVTMSDATGFGTGGTSELLTVGAPVGSASCNTANATLPFEFNLPYSLQQCSSYTFDGYSGATLPITIAGLIPGGDSFLLYTPSSGLSYSWVADVAAGTTIIFTLTDASGKPGGSSSNELVASSSDATCLNSNSPSSTVSPTPSSTSTSSTSSPTSSSKTTPGVSSGTIIGAAVGAVLAITAIVALAVLYLKRQRHKRSSYGLAPTRSRRPDSVELDPGMDNFQHPPIYPFPYQSGSTNHLVPPLASSSPATPASYQQISPSSEPSFQTSGMRNTLHSRTSSNANTDSFAVPGDVASSSMSSSGRRKAAMAGMTAYQSPARFIVHTDAEDNFPEDEAEVIELPPQYSERRTLAMHPTEEQPVPLTGPKDVDEPLQSSSHLPE